MGRGEVVFFNMKTPNGGDRVSHLTRRKRVLAEERVECKGRNTKRSPHRGD